LGPESGADSVAALENSTTIPCTLHLVFTAFRAQPFGPVAIFVHFGVGRRSFSLAKPRPSRLELRENSRRRCRK